VRERLIQKIQSDAFSYLLRPDFAGKFVLKIYREAQ